MTANLPVWANIIIAVVGVIGTAGIGGMLKTLLDHKRGVRAQSDGVALDLVKQLSERVKTLEAAREQDHAKCEAELGVHRHRLNNQKQIIYALLFVFEMPPERQPEAVKRVREDLARLEQAEATEKAIIASAPLTGAGA
jgi:thymidine phosphorylase